MNTSLLRRYASAFYSVKNDNKQSEDGLVDILFLAKTFSEYPALAKLLSSKTVGREERLKLIDTIFSSQLPSDTLLFLKMTSIHYLTEGFSVMAEEYRHLLNESRGILEGRIYSALPLSETQVQNLEEAFSRKLGYQVEFTVHIRKELLGGVQVFIKDHLVDASLNTKIDTIKEKLIEKSSLR